MTQYQVTGMSCAACQARVEKAVSQVPGVTSCAVSLLTNSMGVDGTADSEAIIQAVEKAGYGAALQGAESRKGREAVSDEPLKDTETPVLKRRLILSAVFLCMLMYITMGFNMWGWPLPGYFTHNHLGLALTQMLLALIVMIINKKFFVSGFTSLRHGAPNMDTLVALGSSVSFGWSLLVVYKMCGMITRGAANMDLMELYHNELYFESAAMIPALITIGKMLEARSKGKTTDALKSLMKLAPKTAFILRDGEEVEIPVEEVNVGDIFTVRPGQAIPVDGIVESGSSAVDEAALTGESVPVDKVSGDKVSAGTMNRSGFISCRATEIGEDTALSRIIRLVSEAAATKAPIARIADKVSGVFVPAVIGIALLVIVGWLLSGQTLSFALARGISVLVISCPCALGLATPVAIMVGSGLGAKNGILFKTGESLETAGKVQIIALDKTGTITEGQPGVTDLIPASGMTEEELALKAAALEKFSEHPLAKAIVSLYDEKKETLGSLPELTDFQALPGNGLIGKINGTAVYGGSGSFIRSLLKVDGYLEAEEKRLSEEGKTPLFFAENGRLLGIIGTADRMREDSAEAISAFQRMGLEVVMLTGDNERTAEAIGKKAGVDRVIAGVLPEGKEAVIRELQTRGATAMVGDGINDAPALTRADVGIAIGAGTDVAVDSADIVLMNSKLSDVAAAVRLSRGTLRNIHENLFWAFFYNIVCIPLAAGLFGWKMNPMIGAVAMSLSSFTVCMNALRLNLFKLHDASHDRPLKKRASAGNFEIDPKLSDNNIKQEKETKDMTKTVKINGMMCEHCEARVKKTLEKLPFVETCVPSHKEKKAVLTLNGDFDEAAVKQAVEDQDYEYVGVEE